MLILMTLRVRVAEKYAKKAALAEAGIFFDDDYDYSQHLRDSGQPGAEFIAADATVLKQAGKDVLIREEAGLNHHREKSGIAK